MLRLRTVALVVLGAVVLGGAAGLLLSDASPSAAYVPGSPGAADPEAAPTSTHTPPAPSTGPTGSGGRTAETVDPPAPDDEAWETVLGGLDAVRSEAFLIGDLALLGNVYVDGSVPLERDAAALADLAAAGVRAVELRLVVDKVSVVQEAEDEVVLRVVDHMPGYRLVRPDGSVAEIRAGRGFAEWLVTLRGGAGGWRIAAISSG